MRIHASPCGAALAAAAFLALPAPAQLQVFGGTDTERTQCSIFIADNSGGDFVFKAAVAVGYSAPLWKDSYDAQLESPEFKNKNHRLGKNWWTTFDTSVALDVAGAKIAPGTYYLGIHLDQAGKFHLLVLDAKTALTEGWSPADGTAWKPHAKVPMALAKNSLKEKAEKLQIEITADKQKPTTGRFSIRWGMHELSAPVTYLIAGPKDASGDKGK